VSQRVATSSAIWKFILQKGKSWTILASQLLVTIQKRISILIRTSTIVTSKKMKMQEHMWNRANRELPHKLVRESKQAKREMVLYLEEEDVFSQVWADKREVRMISTIHSM